MRRFNPWHKEYGALARPHMPDKHALAHRQAVVQLKLDRLAQQTEAEARYRRWQEEHPDG
jgi:hypothetical protein